MTILWKHTIATYHVTGSVKWSTSDEIPVTRAEIEANVTELIADELVGSVIECEIDGDTFHRDVSSDEESLDWGDWEEDTKAL